VASAASFASGAAWPLLLLLLAPAGVTVPAIIAGSLLSLSILGALAARAGGAGMLKGALRVTLWSALAMALTMAIGSVFGRLP
jgi:VIT1/CCC1 family predicted Fe2+/Mn2+ transporter